jgi:DnaJ-class molecular chaperone
MVAQVTPYAVLLVHPDSIDAEVRKQFHALIKHHHPDSSGVEGTAQPEWFRLNAAYSLIKTAKDRDLWLHRQLLLSRTCPGCAGLGVLYVRRVVAVCTACAGEGRNAKP